jgi:hypothetical protein
MKPSPLLQSQYWHIHLFPSHGCKAALLSCRCFHTISINSAEPFLSVILASAQRFLHCYWNFELALAGA